MTDKELIQQRIDELQHNIVECKATGKTYRAINKCIEELFSKPIGSEILLNDDPKSDDQAKVHEFANEFSKRMQRDFPDINFKIIYPRPAVAIAIRKSKTYQEIAKQRLEQWKKKLEEMN